MRSTVIRLALVWATAATLVACQADEEKLAEHMARGDEYLEAADYKSAIIEYKNVLQIDPNVAAAHYGLAKAYIRNERPRDGFWELRETVRLDPSNVEAKFQLGQLLVLAGDPEEALKHADDAIAAAPEESNGYLVRGQALEALKRPDEALETFYKAVDVAPDLGGPLYVLATALTRRNDLEAAEKYLNLYVERDPGFRSYSAFGNFLVRYPERDDETLAALMEAASRAEGAELLSAHSQVAGFYFQRERFDEATSYLDVAIKEVDEPLDLIYLQARLYLARGDDEKADELIEQATRTSPDDPKPHLILSAYRGRKGDVDGALAAAEKAMEIAPDNSEANLRVAEILVDIGYRDGDPAKIERGRTLVEAVLVKEPTQSSGLMVKAKIDLAEKKVDDAIASLRAAIDAKPDLAQAHYILGTALSLKGEKTAARTELAKALEIDASLLEARRVLARVHSMLGEHEYAIEEGRRYLKERPDSAETRILIAQSLVILKRPDEAQAELAQIPGDKRGVEVLYALGRVHMRTGDDAQAREYLTAALAQMPTHQDILRNLLRLDREQNRFPESVARVRAAVAAEPDNAKLRILSGIVALIDQRPDDAEAEFKKAVELAPEDVAGYEHLARMYSRSGKLDEAVKTYEDALAVRPEDPNIHHFLGILYQYGGARDKAIERYEDAIKYGPDLAEAKNNLAYIYAEGDENLDRALDLAQEAKAALPDSANAADTLGWVLLKRGIPSASVSYLKEAEAGKESDDATIGIIRHHLAQAYEADGANDSAVAALERALAPFDQIREESLSAGQTAPPEPRWTEEARNMLMRLQAESASS